MKSLTQSHHVLCLATCLLSGVATAANAKAANAKDVKFKDTILELQAGDRLVVTGIRGSIKFTEAAAQEFAKGKVVGRAEAETDVSASSSTARTAAVTLRGRKTLNDRGLSQWSDKFDALAMQTRREGHTVFVEVKGPQSKSDWAEWTSNNSPEMALEFSLPGLEVVPVEASLHGGTISALGWRAPMTLSVVQGAIKTSETLGDLSTQIQRGEIRISQHHGSVDVDSFAGKLFAEKIEGDIHLDNFSGETHLKEVAGNVFVRTHNGGTNVADSSGSIDFELGRGPLTVAKFEGPVRGQTDSAAVLAKLEGESDVNIESAQGPVAVRLPASSGAIVRLQTETGSLNVPEEIQAAQTASSKLASGRMNGTGPRGMVTIKSKAASIRVRQDTSAAGGKPPSAPTEDASE